MGHLGNPVGFRLGFGKKWNFNFFVKNIYYPEYINNLINIRDYLYYYLTRKLVLKSGVCLSHLYLFKHLKQYYIKIYIYHIDLEKQSYDYINKWYHVYYNVYNKRTYKQGRRTPQQWKRFQELRELNYADLVLFYWNSATFYQKSPKKHTLLLQQNTYIKNENILIYSNYIIYHYLRFYFLLYIKKFWTFFSKNKNFNKTKKNKKIKLDIENNNVFKLKEPVNYKMLLYAQIILKKIFFFPYLKHLIMTDQVIPKKILKYVRLQYNLLSEKKKKFLDLCLKCTLGYYSNKKQIKAEKKVKKYLFYFIKHKYKLNKKLKFIYYKRIPKKLKNILYDDTFYKKYWEKMPRISFEDFTKKKKFMNFSLLQIFLVLAKKVGFQKVRNARTLKIKWAQIANYIKMFKFTNSIKSRSILTNNINPFLYLLYTFIFLSEITSKKIGIMFNLKHSLYYCIYFGVFITGFYDALKVIVQYLKQGINLLNPLIPLNSIVFYFFFLTNQNVTSQLVARYIALKLVRGFTLKKILTPLKRELIRVSLKGRGKQVPYSKRINYKAIQRKRKIILRTWVQTFLQYYWSFFLINIYNKWKRTDTLIFIKNFYAKIKNKKIKKIKKDLACILKVLPSYKFLFNNWLKKFKLFFVHQFDTNKKRFFNRLIFKKKLILKVSQIKRKKKRFYLAYLRKQLRYKMIYPFILNIDKKKALQISEIYPLYLIENAYDSSFKFINNLFSNNKKKKVNSMQIAVSSFFNKNYINFKVMQALWLTYKKFNIRNLRQLYLPIFVTGLMGFKIVFKGRFSRKQRVSKATLNIGKVPLNTLEAKIDYTMLTTTLVNSALSIKLYMYKNNIIQGYKNVVKL